MEAGSGRGSVPEESQDRERQIPELAEAELQPAGGGVAALEGPPQASDQRERRLGLQVAPPRTCNQFQNFETLPERSVFQCSSSPGFSQR